MVLLQKSKNSDLLFRLWGVSGFIFPPLSWSIVILALDTCLLSQTNFFVIFHNQCFGKYLKWRWKLFEFGGHFTASFLVEDLCDCCEQKKRVVYRSWSFLAFPCMCTFQPICQSEDFESWSFLVCWFPGPWFGPKDRKLLSFDLTVDNISDLLWYATMIYLPFLLPRFSFPG